MESGESVWLELDKPTTKMRQTLYQSGYSRMEVARMSFDEAFEKIGESIDNAKQLHAEQWHEQISALWG